MHELVSIALLAAISVLSVRLGAFVVGLLRRDRYVVFAWEEECDDCGEALVQTSVDERECPDCNLLYPDMDSPFWQEVARKIKARTRP